LGKLTELRHLDLHGIPVSDEYVGFLGELTALRSLNLGYNQAITDKGIDQLNIAALESLDIRGCEKPQRHKSFINEL